MIRMPVSRQDLVQTRLTYSPMWEAILSYRAVALADRHTLPVPWAAQLRRDAARLDLRPLCAALADGTVLFDFLFPLPTSHDVSFADQIEQLTAQRPDEVARQVGWHYESMDEAPLPEVRPFVERPRQSLDRLASALTSYWDQAFRPHWPRLRAALEADLLHRGKAVAVEGTATMLRGLHPQIRWRGHGLDIERPVDWEVEAERPGLVLVPSAFGWPSVVAGTMGGVKIVLYPARGLGTLWEHRPLDASEAVEALLGPTRARVALALRAPMATSDLAAVLDVAGSSVSYHLAHLRRAGMVEWHREGRRVLYRLSALGAGLLRLWGLDETAGPADAADGLTGDGRPA